MMGPQPILRGSGRSPAHEIFFGLSLDYCPFLCLYSEYLVPPEGAALTALDCGDDPDGGGGDAPAQSRDRSGDIRPVGAVAGVAPRKRAPAAQAALVPARQPRVTGYGGRCVRCVITWMHRSTPTAVGRHWTRAYEERRRRLKGSPTGG